MYDQNTEQSIESMGGSAESDFEVLVNRRMESELDNKLRGSMIGGYSKKSVEGFVSEMRNNLHQVKAQLEQQIHEMAAEKASISQECVILREQLKRAEESLLDARNVVERQESNEHILKQQFENILAEKEEEIKNLNDRLNEYGEAYEKLEAKLQLLEQKDGQRFISAADEVQSDQYQELEFRYQELQEKMRLVQAELVEKQYHLDQTKVQLQTERRSRESDERIPANQGRLLKVKELEKELEKKQLYLERVRERLEQKKQELIREQEQNILQKQQLEKERREWDADRLSCPNETAAFREIEYLKERLAEKEEQVAEALDKCQKQQQDNEGLEGQITGLYQEYLNIIEKAEQLGQVISERDLQLADYQKQEAQYIALQQENEHSKKVINSLKGTVQKISRQMEGQLKELNECVAAMIRDRESLETAIREQTALKLHNMELIEQHTHLNGQLERLKEEKQQLLEVQQSRNKLVSKTEKKGKIVNLGDFSDDKKDPSSNDVNQEVQICDEAYQRAKQLLQQLEKQDKKEGYWKDQDYS